MPKLSPYDRAVSKAHSRQERRLRVEHSRHAARLDAIDLLLKTDLHKARLLARTGELPQSMIDQIPIRVAEHDPANQNGWDTTLGEFFAANSLSDDERREIMRSLHDKAWHKGGGGAAPTWEIWL